MTSPASEFEMGLYETGFEMIKSGKKHFEVRLNDEKRQQIKTGDIILFYMLPDKNEKLKTQVKNVVRFENFKSLYESIGLEALGRANKTMEWMMESTYSIYSKEQELKYGAVAFEIQVI